MPKKRPGLDDQLFPFQANARDLPVAAASFGATGRVVDAYP
jgi:hypothetical protein